jgi:glycosyltransferase involved in cell wall biosynthesis
MKKVLMIAYLFPPMGGGGVQRTIKFAKYLPQFGWEPAILTVEEKNYKSSWWKILDPELLEDLPEEAKIYRTFSLDYIFQGKIGKLVHYLCRVLFIPDDQIISWFPFALREAVKILRNEKIDAIYSTSIPYTNHFIGLLLKKLTKKPWIADFRDPWTTNPNYRILSPVHAKINRFCETLIYKCCDTIITSTEGYRHNILVNFHFVKPEKVIAITNGYDPEDFRGIEKTSNNTTSFTITYLSGSSYGDYFLRDFLKGMKTLFDINPRVISKIKVNLLGEDPRGVHLINHFGFPNGVFYFLDYVSQKHVGKFLLNSDLLLLVLPAEKKWENCIPQKTFQYLGAGKPIFAIVPEGCAADLVRNSNAGVVVNPQDSEKIAETIYSFLQKKERGELEYFSDFLAVKNFDRRIITDSLAQILNRAIKNRNEE